MLQDNNIDAVIGLPSNLFYSTGIPVCVLVLKKCKKQDDVLFINASAEEHYKKGRRQNHLRKKDIGKIVQTYKYRKEEERYSSRIDITEIEENGFNLNITRYVSTAKPEKKIDLNDVNKELVALDKKINEARKAHNHYLKDLGLNPIK